MYYNSAGRPDPGDLDDIGGFTVERDSGGNLTFGPGQFYLKSGACKIVVTPDITEAEFALAVAAFLAALPEAPR
jgi:hypothetical protein